MLVVVRLEKWKKSGEKDELHHHLVAPWITVNSVCRVTSLPVLRIRVLSVAQDTVHQAQLTKHNVSVAIVSSHATVYYVDTMHEMQLYCLHSKDRWFRKVLTHQ
jgi:hypothetical protein